MPDGHTPRPGPAPIAWSDGRVLPASEATVPLLDDGFLRGDAVFETVLVRAGRTHALDAHLDRLRASARALGIRVPLLRRPIEDLLAAWGAHDGALKLIVTRQGTVRGLLTRPSWPDSLALHVVHAPWRTPLAGTKTLSYAVNQWATREARAAHADDALIVSEGAVCELPTAAVVWVSDEGLRAPDPQRLPILSSVTLAELRRVVDVELGVWPVEELLAADEVFVVSATRPVLAIHAIDDREYPAPGPVTTQLGSRFDDHIARTLDGPG